VKRRTFIAGLGSAVAWPIVALAQRPTVPVIGFLSSGFANPNADYAVAFRQGLADAGYVEGRNVAIEYRWANGQGRALRPLAEELAHRPVDAIVAAVSNNAAHAAKAATSTIPIVFIYGADPVKDGLVASLSRPGGNITGVASLTWSPCRRNKQAPGASFMKRTWTLSPPQRRARGFVISESKIVGDCD
jgi:putative tryptophan/tyrosine transport system substrate-binding protein